jgi:hypothetical protein
MATISWLATVPGFAGFAGVLYFSLVSVISLVAVLSSKKTRRDAAKSVLQLLLWRRYAPDQSSQISKRAEPTGESRDLQKVRK